MTAQTQFEELRRASRYAKFQDILQSHQVDRMLNNLRDADVLDHLPDRYQAADPQDAWLLAVADIGKADFLVTGDKKSGLLVRRRIGRARILTAAAFCSIID